MAKHAREIADAGDRWFLAVAGGLGRLGGWARREADFAVESAAAAFATTVQVAKKLSGVEDSPRVTRRALGRAPTTSTLDKRSSKGRRSRSAPLPEAEPSITLMPATPATAEAHGPIGAEHPGCEPEPEKNPAGVVPLIQALGRTVADHTHGGYATLEGDDRFWTLIHLLELLGRPGLASELGLEEAPADAAPRAEKPEGNP